MTGYHSLDITLADGIATVCMNAMSLGANPTYELSRALRIMQSDTDVDVVIITGKKNVFMSGADLNMVGDMESYEVAQSFLQIPGVLWRMVYFFEKVLIAAINGYCLGGGLELALACDYRVCVDKVTNFIGNSVPFIGFPETSLGIVPLLGGSQFLSQTLGKAVAKTLLYSAELIGAEKAQELGLVNEVSTYTELHDKARAYARKVQENCLPFVSQAKRGLNNSLFYTSWQLQGDDVS